MAGPMVREGKEQGRRGLWVVSLAQSHVIHTFD